MSSALPEWIPNEEDPKILLVVQGKAEIIVNEHGGNIHRTAEMLGRSVGEIIDFSSNINPLGIPSDLKGILKESVNGLEYYPDPEYRKLRSCIAEYVNMYFENTIACNGALEAIFLLLKTVKPCNIVLPAPCFSEYQKAAKEIGANIHFLKLCEHKEFKLDLKELINRIERGADCVLLCNPNNPTSTIIPADNIKEIVKVADKVGTTVIVDEAFIELTDEGSKNSVVNMTGKYKNLFVIRAFTKVFAVPGIRLGYAVGNSTVIEKMILNAQCWSVNSIAVSAGEFLKRSQNYLEQTKKWLMTEKLRFYDKLSEIPKIKVFKPETNFVLVKLLSDSIDSRGLKERLAKRGILIRDASNFKFLNKKFVRFAIKDKQSNDVLIKVLKNELKCIPHYYEHK